MKRFSNRNARKRRPLFFALFLAFTLILSGTPFLSGTEAGLGKAYATSYTVPNLMITEVTPDTKILGGGTGTPDAFEFVELYNNTGATINLKNYSIIYETPTVYTWTITTDKYIASKGTFIVWIKSVATATLANFNSNYGVSLPSSQVFEVSASGMANASPRTLSIADPSSVKISTVSYDAPDVTENIGIQYLYPIDASKVMRKFASSDLASPGSVFAGQVPPAAWDSVAPAAPAGLSAAPGSSMVTLSWNANSESDIAFYRVYKSGSLYSTVKASKLTATVTGLVDEADTTFQISAVDTSNNESTQTSSLTSAALSIPVTQVSVVGTPSGSFPEYNAFFNVSTAGPIIPALLQDLVPQGIAYVASQNWFLVSHYRSDGKSSMLTVIDAASGAMVKSMTVYNANKTPYVGHAGGIAVTATDVWIASGSYLRRVPLQDVINVQNRNRVYIADRFLTSANASFTTFANGILWSGEFYASPDYLTDTSHNKTTRTGSAHHAWMVGYNLDVITGQLPAGKYVNDTTVVTPDYILSIPDKIQGAATLADGRFALSNSFGRNTDSNVWFYQNVLTQTPHYYSTVNGSSVPSWFLDGVSITSSVVAPPASEGMVVNNGYLYMMFESAATDYRTTGKYALDNIQKVNLSSF